MAIRIIVFYKQVYNFKKKWIDILNQFFIALHLKKIWINTSTRPRRIQCIRIFAMHRQPVSKDLSTWWVLAVPVETTPTSLTFVVGRWQPPGEQTMSDRWEGSEKKHDKRMAPWPHITWTYLYQLQTYVHLTPPQPQVR